MRLAGQIKLGYYPTPPRVVDLIRERLEFAGPYAALDPCAGEGDALAQLCTGTERTLYGIEPEDNRAAAARENLDRVLHSTLEESRLSHCTWTLLYLNPPYDEEHEVRDEGEKRTTRKEIAFLNRTLPLLAPAGVLVFVVPAHIFTPEVRLFLSQKFDNLEIWHFPEPERSEYKQAVAIGTRSAEKRINPAVLQITDEPPLDKPRHTVPISLQDVKIFKSHAINPADLAQLARTSPLYRLFAGSAETRTQERRPPLALHAGHLSLLIASGAVDGLTGTGEERHVLRGKTTKYQKSVTEENYNAETGSTTKTTRTRDCYRVSVKLLRPTGQILELE